MNDKDTEIKLLFSDYFEVDDKVEDHIKKAEIRVSKLSQTVLVKYLWKN